MRFPEKELKIDSISVPSNVDSPEPPRFLENPASIEVLANREGLSWLLREGNQGFILIDHHQVSKLVPFPVIRESAELVTQTLKEKSWVAFLTGAMYSGKSEVFNRVVIDFVNMHLGTKVDLLRFRVPVWIGRATKARRLDSMSALQDNLSFLSYNFNLQIEGPLDFLRFINQNLRNLHPGPKLAALEEVGVLLFSRPEYLWRIRRNPTKFLEEGGVPENLRTAFNRALVDEDSDRGFSQEIILMAQILRQRGIRLLMAGPDRFTSGDIWAPTGEMSVLAQRMEDEILIHRRFSECVGCGEPAGISTVTEGYYWELEIEGRTYSLYPFMHNLEGLVEAVEPYYAPLCEACNNLVRPEIPSTDWPAIEWP